MHWCLSCRHGFVMRSPGSWLGGSRVSALRLFLFLLGTSRSSCYVLALCCCFKDDPLRTGHTSCLVITSHCRYWILHSNCDVLFLCLGFGVFWFVCFCFLVFVFSCLVCRCFLFCHGMVSSIRAQRTR